MKKIFLLPAFAALAMTAMAQDFDTNPVVKIENQEEELQFTVGARMMADVAYYHSDFTPLKSGAALTDARIRTSMKYKDWYFYADFDFSKGKFKQKNIFMQYSFGDEANQQAVKAGYYNDAASMARNTSLGSYHFISRPAPANALQAGRQLGVTYKYRNDKFFANQGVFAENLYNDQIDGFQGVTVSGRWLYSPIKNGDETFHVGLNARYANICSGVNYNDVLQTKVHMSSPLETYVDGNTEFLNTDILWAKHVVNAGAEFLYHNDKFFARGEYMFKYITKERDDETLFKNQLGTLWSWGSLASWQGGNPLRNNMFHGAYVEAGYKIFGNAYKYNAAEGILGGLNGKSLEVVARYSYTGLNDIVDGAYYFEAQDKYIDNGILSDYPAASTCVSGGNLHAATVGVNYSFNKFVQVMLDYTYSRLDRDQYKYDKNFHAVQARLMFSF